MKCIRLIFSPDGKTLAGGSYDATIVLWDVGTGHPKKTLTGHTAGVYSVAFSPDGRTLASGGRDETIRFWDVDTEHSCEPCQDISSQSEPSYFLQTERC